MSVVSSGTKSQIFEGALHDFRLPKLNLLEYLWLLKLKKLSGSSMLKIRMSMIGIVLLIQSDITRLSGFWSKISQ